MRFLTIALIGLVAGLLMASPVASQVVATTQFEASAAGQLQYKKAVEITKTEYVSYQHYVRQETEKKEEYIRINGQLYRLTKTYDSTEEITAKTTIKETITTVTEQRNEAWVAYIAAWKQRLDVRILISSQFHIWGDEFRNEMALDKIEWDTNWADLMAEIHKFHLELDSSLHALGHWASQRIAAMIHGSESGLHYASVEGMKFVNWTEKTADQFWAFIWGDVKKIWIFLGLKWGDFAHWAVDSFDHTRDNVMNTVHSTENRFTNAYNAWNGANTCPPCPPQPSCANGIGGNSATSDEVHHEHHEEEHEGKHRRSHRGGSVHVSVNVE